MMEELKMKKIKLMMMALLVSVVAVGCSSASNGESIHQLLRKQHQMYL